MATLTVSATEDFSDGSPAANNITKIFFGPAVAASATFAGSQFGGSRISNTVTIDGANGGNSHIQVNLAASSAFGATNIFSAAGWKFSNWFQFHDDIAFTGTTGADSITGSSQPDFIEAGGGLDVVDAGGGDDAIKFKDSEFVAGETIDGGVGTDKISLNGANGVFNLSSATITNVERLVFLNKQTATLAGSQIGAGGFSEIQGNDGSVQTLIVNGSTVNLSGLSFTAWNNADLITINGSTFSGNTLVGSSQKDTINGAGAFADTITGGLGIDTLNGGGGNDTFRYVSVAEAAAGENVQGDGGTDKIALLNAGVFDLTSLIIASVEQLQYSAAGASTVTFKSPQFGGAGTAFNKVIGGAGTNALIINSVAGVDLSGLTFNSWTPGTDTITINGTAGGDPLTGSSQNDIITGGNGSDKMNGGEGDDIFRYAASGEVGGSEFIGGLGGTDALEISGGTHDFSGGAVTLSSVEALLFSGAASTGATFKSSQIGGPGGIVAVTGSAGANAVVIQAIGDVNLSVLAFTSWTASTDTITLNGSAGGENLKGTSQNDIINGKGGDDLLFVNNAGDVVNEAAGGGSDRVLASLTYALASGQEIELFTTTDAGGTVDINLTGNELAQRIDGNAGKNIIDGKGGADTMNGGGGDDKYVVDNASDVANEAAGAGSDRVLASVSYTLKTGQSIELFTTTNAAGTTAINLTGNELAQTFNGNAGGNTIDGRGGADTMDGFGGDDFYFVDNAGDVVNEATAAGSDRVLTSVSYTLKAGQSIELFTPADAAATTAIDLTGNELAQTVRGNAGANTIAGKDGNDTLGGLGGNDKFVFDTALNTTTNIDSITDFTPGGDKIELENSIFTTLTTPGTLAAAAFFAGTAAHDADDRIIYDSATGALVYDSNGNAAGGATQFATLTTHPVITNTDFIVI